MIVAPMLDQIPITYSEWQFNGSFTQENIYRQDPSKEVDEAWDALGINSKLSNSRNVWGRVLMFLI